MGIPAPASASASASIMQQLSSVVNITKASIKLVPLVSVGQLATASATTDTATTSILLMSDQRNRLAAESGVPLLDVLYAVTVIAEELGFADGSAAYKHLVSGLANTCAGGDFVSALQYLQDGSMYSFANCVSVNASSPIMTVVRTRAPTRKPSLVASVSSLSPASNAIASAVHASAVDTGFYSSWPLYAKIVFPIGGFLFLAVALYALSRWILPRPPSDQPSDRSPIALSGEAEPLDTNTNTAAVGGARVRSPE